ncbi:class I SAM-dependent methyltransferase [Streptomyces sp. LP05-1]|uniref:Class I SAM-dependent methyltransferase n=1 Tax=Streptomyces pyxinae TaxID=2970734 RepID=A0ABT2CGB1_9ACTN|nr:class I SAM-dependent methyltransferase [Streptomyces sp. LP05-1]MCS0636459.1 class I SAM-dependent methyltransferase [Streptomyces sp. LP05-1]
MESQFDAAVAAYEASMAEMPFREHIEAHSFLRTVGEVGGLSVLDLGCGSGTYVRRLRSLGAARVAGVDESGEMIAHARRREEREGLGVSYAVGNAAGELPELDGQFDVVTAVYVLPYAPTRDALAGMCATARRALRPEGGRFVAATLNPDFAEDPGWYRPYGMRLTAPTPRGEGGTGHLTAWIGREVLDVDFFIWSVAAHEQALRRAGFTHVSWTRPEVSEEGTGLHGAEFWRAYLACPHALVLDAVAGPPPGAGAADRRR